MFGSLNWQRIVIIILPGIIVGWVMWVIHDGALWQRGIVTLLTIDLVAGVVSNATPQTNAQWRRLMHGYRWLFVVVHVCVYPWVLWLSIASHGLLWMMLMILALKIMFFVRGTIWRVG